MIDIEQILRGVDLVDLVGRYVKLKSDGREFKACCPFHDERTPSFTVVPKKRFVHCFGCGAHHDAIGFLMHITGASFSEACSQLGAREFREARAPRIESARRAEDEAAREIWIPIYPVPNDAPQIIAGKKVALWNPKRKRTWNAKPSRVDPYRDASGRLMGFVLRINFANGEKITPQITWCIGPTGSVRWCTVPFTVPRPLCGLDALAAMPNAPVLIVEGEKCKTVGAQALPQYAVITWPGGSRGVGRADWSPLRDRDVVLWPDADQAGREAMLGYETSAGMLHRGVAQHAHRAGCKSIRMVDPSGQPKGWDIADALDEGWMPRQLAVWAAQRIIDIDVAIDPTRRAA